MWDQTKVKRRRQQPDRKASLGPQPLKDLLGRVARVQKLALFPLRRVPTEPAGAGGMGQFHTSKCIPFHLLQLVVEGEEGQARQVVLHETERSVLP